MPPARASRKRANEPEAPVSAAKRVRSESKTTAASQRGKRGKTDKTGGTTAAAAKKDPTAYATPRKQTLFDVLDVVGDSPSSSTTAGPRPSPLSERQHLENLDDSDDSSLTSLTDQEFEDVPLAGSVDKKGRKGNTADGDDDDDDDDDDIEFEDVAPPPPPLFSAMEDDTDYHGGSGDLELTLHKDTRVSLTNPYGDKKGPSKVERLVRHATHCMHVQALMWHNARRNAWLCDAELQGILLSLLPPRLWDEVDRFRRGSGLEEVDARQERKDKRQAKGKGKGKDKAPASRGSGDWSQAAKRLEQGRGVVDVSHGDPLFRLMRVLSAWWRQTFRITAPGLRKMGYLSLERLDRYLKAYDHAAGLDPRRFGELVPSRAVLRLCAQKLCGSRDVGAQLFTALLRGLGLEARMVASLQPLGFGWNKMEDADREKEDSREENVPTAGIASIPSRPAQAKSRRTPDDIVRNMSGAARRRASRENTIVIDSSEDEKPSHDVDELAEVNSDNDSIVFVPGDEEKEDAAGHRSVHYDQDLSFPHYWTEVLSPVTGKFLPVDALVKHVVATNPELIESLEPRGAKADRARQVLAYVVGFSADGTAKDVTVRYLKRHVLPGRTRGVRVPIEKVPVYNKHGKVKQHELVDWFRLVMRGYERGQRPENPLTEADEEEDATDLRPAQAEKREVKDGNETLQYYKQSKEFVLERHLKREEALVEGAQPVKVFHNAKGKKKKEPAEDEVGESVYKRADVVAVKSAETWHKQGRAPRAGTQPLKRVPYRAATLNRRREIAEAEAATGGPVLQGLYSWEQTDWIIPPPIHNGVIPKNEYGNIDLFVEHMLPQGAVHVPYRAAARVCRRLQIDYAEAVVDFEFGHRMAVPVIHGVVIAKEQHDRLIQEMARDEAERARREDAKRRAAALSLWRKMLMGLRIVERIRQDYGEAVDSLPEGERVFGSSHHDVDLSGEGRAGKEKHGQQALPDVPEENSEGPEDPEDPDMAGGFLPEGYEYEDAVDGQSSSFFPVHDEDGEEESDLDGLVETG